MLWKCDIILRPITKKLKGQQLICKVKFSGNEALTSNKGLAAQGKFVNKAKIMNMKSTAHLIPHSGAHMMWSIQVKRNDDDTHHGQLKYGQLDTYIQIEEEELGTYGRDVQCKREGT